MLLKQFYTSFKKCAFKNNALSISCIVMALSVHSLVHCMEQEKAQLSKAEELAAVFSLYTLQPIPLSAPMPLTSLEKDLHIQALEARLAETQERAQQTFKVYGNTVVENAQLKEDLAKAHSKIRNKESEIQRKEDVIRTLRDRIKYFKRKKSV